MAEESFAQFKTQLENSRKEIGEKLEKLEKVPELGDGYDPDTETQESEEFSKQLGVTHVLKSRLVAIDEALLKLNKKTYGICEKCGKAISVELLKLVPESEFCKECKRLSTNFGNKK